MLSPGLVFGLLPSCFAPEHLQRAPLPVTIMQMMYAVLSQGRDGVAQCSLPVGNSQTKQPQSSHPTLPGAKMQGLEAAGGPGGNSHNSPIAKADLQPSQPLQQQHAEAKVLSIRHPAKLDRAMGPQPVPAVAHRQQAGTVLATKDATGKPAKSRCKPAVTAAAAQTGSASAQQAMPVPNRWPGSCSQGVLADANEVHGMAAVVVRARRATSCSGSSALRQHAAKKLTFRQLTLAGQPMAGCASGEGRAAQTGGERRRQTSPVKHSAPDAQASAAAAESLPERRQSSGQVDIVTAALAQAAGAKWAAADTGNKLQQAHSGQSQLNNDQLHSAQQHKTADQQRRPQQEGAVPEQAEGGSQQQWETAISQLHVLAEKHSQDSQDNASAGGGTHAQPNCTAHASPPDHVPEAWTRQTEALVRDAADKAAGVESAQAHIAPGQAGPTVKVRDQAAVSSSLHSAAQTAPRQQQLPEANTQQGAVLASSARPGWAGQPGTYQAVGHTAAAPARAEAGSVPKAARRDYTGFSHLKQVMRQQKQQQAVHQCPSQGRGQTAGQCQDLPTEAAHGQTSQQGKEQGSGQSQVQGQKRKCPETEDALENCSVHAEEGSCKRPCLQAPQLARSGSLPAQADEQLCLVDASHIAGIPQQGAMRQGTAPTAELAGEHVCLNPSSTGGRSAGAELLVNLAAGAAAMALPDAEVLTAAAVAEPVAILGIIQGGARVQEASQGQAGVLRLDLSSEEDPLLCTQRMPSSQGWRSCQQDSYYN